MKKEFRAHPLMIVSLMRPFLFVLVLPVLKGVVQYIVSREVTGVLTLEIILFAAIVFLAAVRCAAFRLVCGDRTVTVKSGVIFRTSSVMSISKLSSVQTVQNPADAVFGAVTYRINTEAGRRGKADFEFKLSRRDSAEVSKRLYGAENPTAVRFSVIKVAMMAATTSSAVTGMIVAVPVINRAGKLLGVALDRMLFDEINEVSGEIQSYFPPVVNTISLIFLLAYAVAFVYSFIKYINFSLFLERDKLEVRSGFFVRSRTSFKKESVNDVIIDQTPLMRIFRRYAMKVRVGGYGGARGDAAVIVPSGRHGEIKRQFSMYFPFLAPDGRLLHPVRGGNSRGRFLFFPTVYFIATATVSLVLALIFPDFGRLILFLMAVTECVVLYYGYLSVFEYRYGKLRLGRNVYAHSVRLFNTCELYCPADRVGEIRLTRTPPDIRRGTCKARVTVRSESADSIRVRNLDYEEVKREIAEHYGIEV